MENRLGGLPMGKIDAHPGRAPAARRTTGAKGRFLSQKSGLLGALKRTHESGAQLGTERNKAG